MNSIAELQLQYGEAYQSITNIVYTNGLLDPWLYDGVTWVGTENATLINIDCKYILLLNPYINDGFFSYSTFFLSDHSGSADLTSISGWDSYQLTLAKREIHDIINNWSIHH